MNKKISLGVAVSLFILVAALASAITLGVVSSEYNSILKGLPEKIERYEILDELDDVINSNYYGKSEAKDLEQAIAQGYVEGLGDKSSLYMTADRYKEYLSEVNGDMFGIGVEYTKTKSGYIEITKVYDGSPAENSGLRAGDVIVAFDGIRIDVNNYDEMKAKLEGDKLTSVNIIYTRDGTETNVTVVKGYEAQSVFTGAYNGVGYLEITDFYPSTAEQTQQAIEKFLSSEISAVVVDLRKNTSGNYEQAMKTLDVFVPMSDSQRAAATVLDENGSTVKTFSTLSGEVSLPVAVLVSGETQKAAELFACNIRDFNKGMIFGTGNTKGSAMMQEIFELSKGSAVLLTTGTVMPYKSESFNGTGITPDYITEASSGSDVLEEDGQFLYAVSVLKGEQA
ncbi:MAG: PDZ domain-containing protein [Ruminococcaceae bacterium]|nr:PDZ domain-containing protein [Oscillospiraceae bacterium]